MFLWLSAQADLQAGEGKESPKDGDEILINLSIKCVCGGASAPRLAPFRRLASRHLAATLTPPAPASPSLPEPLRLAGVRTAAWLCYPTSRRRAAEASRSDTS